ncbi:hypothetical protein Ancab_010639, partial [Ancistrocladus abbreviatus]
MVHIVEDAPILDYVLIRDEDTESTQITKSFAQHHLPSPVKESYVLKKLTEGK